MSPQACRSLTGNSALSRCTSARRPTSPMSLFESPIAAFPCPASDPPPIASGAHSHPAAASLPVLRSRPCRRTSTSIRKSCASIPRTHDLHLLPFAPPQPVSALRSSALPCASLSSCPFLRLKSYFDSDGAKGSCHPELQKIFVTSRLAIRPHF